jgi:hypothetical protein
VSNDFLNLSRGFEHERSEERSIRGGFSGSNIPGRGGRGRGMRGHRGSDGGSMRGAGRSMGGPSKSHPNDSSGSDKDNLYYFLPLTIQRGVFEN